MIYTIIPETLDGNFIGDYTRDDLVRATYCYLHGKLEGMVGYDIFSMLRSELLPEYIQEEHWVSNKLEGGIYPCTCMGESCTFFRWKSEFPDKYSGLVVLDSDKEAWLYAFHAFLDKRISI